MQPMANTALRAARAASTIMLRALDNLEALTVEKKARNDFVSQVDRDTEAALIEALHKAYPDHAITGEEHGTAIPASNNSEYRWGDRRGVIQDYVMLVNGEPASGVCSTGDRIEVRVRAVFSETVANPIYGLTIKTADGVTVYGANTLDRKVEVEPGESGTVAIIRFRFTADLVTADYFISLGLAEADDLKGSVAVDRRFDLIHLYVSSDHLDFGIVSLNMDIDRMVTHDAQ